MIPVTALIKEDTVVIPADPNIPLSPQEKRVIKLFPGATLADWEDWRWQIRNRLRTLDQISKLMTLTQREVRGIKGHGGQIDHVHPAVFCRFD